MVMPGPMFPRLGSLLVTMANLSDFGSHAKSVTVSGKFKYGLSPGFGSVGEGMGPLTFNFNDLHRVLFLPHAEDLEVAVRRLLRFSEMINLDAQVRAALLPVKLGL